MNGAEQIQWYLDETTFIPVIAGSPDTKFRILDGYDRVEIAGKIMQIIGFCTNSVKKTLDLFVAEVD